MPSSAHEFKARSYKEVTLPSGLSVLIRKVQLWDQLGLGELAIPSTTTPSTNGRRAEEVHASRLWSDRLIERAAVAPRFTADPKGTDDPETVHVLDLDNEDYNALALAVMRHAGLTSEVAAQVDAFRGDPERQDSQDPGSDLPQAAERVDVPLPG